MKTTKRIWGANISFFFFIPCLGKKKRGEDSFSRQNK